MGSAGSFFYLFCHRVFCLHCRHLSVGDVWERVAVLLGGHRAVLSQLLLERVYLLLQLGHIAAQLV